MKVCMVHNYYQQTGGEDQVFAEEAALLKDRGHDVSTFTVHNDVIDTMGRLQLFGETLWGRSANLKLSEHLRQQRADVVHFHNTFPLLSPSTYSVARRTGAAVVQTLHNYRLGCTNALFYRDGGVCEACLGKSIPWRGIMHGCYRGSKAASAGVAAMIGYHRASGTWQKDVDAYIALTHFAAGKFAKIGLPSDKTVVKPNFVFPDPGVGTGSGGFALFVGRLSAEKGVDVLVKAWSQLGDVMPLKIAGDGPLVETVREASSANRSIEYLGKQNRDQIFSLMGNATMLVVPSIWFEGMPRTVVEAFARGTPAVCSNLGGLAEMVEHHKTGLLFTPGNAEELANCVREISGDISGLAAMRSKARAEYDARYTADRNYDLMLACYEDALSRRKRAG